jgi:hypothetical protein
VSGPTGERPGGPPLWRGDPADSGG